MLEKLLQLHHMLVFLVQPVSRGARVAFALVEPDQLMQACELA